MGKIPTVKVVNPSNEDDYLIINEEDFDPDVHTPWEERDAESDDEGSSVEMSAGAEDLVEEHDLDIAALVEAGEIEGTGSGGKVIKPDVEGYLAGLEEGSEE